MSTYQIGQVLFVVSNKKKTVIPVQVIEKLIKQTISGDNVTYVVTTGDDNLDLGKIDGEVFESPMQLQDVLLDRAMSAISKMISEATTIAANSFEYDSKQNKKQAVDVKNDESNQTLVTLGDGTVARLKLPEGFVNE